MAQKGFEYEENSYAILEKFDIVTGGTAGASHDKPDLMLKNSKNKKIGCELKISPTAAGSLVMKYTDGKWSYGDFAGEAEKEFLQAIGEEYNLLREMNTTGTNGQNWRGKVPALQNDTRGKKIIIGASNKQEAYKSDIARFGAENEVHIKVPAKAISDYYITKKCSYINVGTHGFFTLSNKDILGLNGKLAIMGHSGIPDFNRSADCMIRVRCQYKGGGDYQFVMTLQFSKVAKSPYNIAPLKKGSSSTIDLIALKKDPLLLAFS
jgi:hypothetical protein